MAFNLFDFSNVPGTSTQKIGTGSILPQNNTPVSSQTISNSPSSQGMKFFKDEEEANVKMLKAGLTQEQADKLHKERRNSLLGKISQEDAQALIKMREAGLDTTTASSLVNKKREESGDTRPLWKKAGEGATNFLAGNLDTVLKYGGNLLDVATLGKAGFGEDVKGITEQNKELFKDSGAFTAGSYLPDIAMSVAPLGKAVQSMSALKGGALVGSGYGALNPLLNKGSEATATDVGVGTVMGGAIGAVAGPILGKVVDKSAKYGTALIKGGVEGIKKSVSRDFPMFGKDAEQASRKLYEGIAKVGIPKGKTVPQVKSELDRGYSGAKEFVSRNPNLKVDVIQNFEKDIPNTLRQTFKNYDNMAKANKEDLATEMEKTAMGAINKHLKGLSAQSQKELQPVVESLRKKFGGYVDENGQRVKLTMEQVQNELKNLNSDLRKSYTSGKSSQENSIVQSVVDDVHALADKKLTTAYGGERGAYANLKSFSDQTRNVWIAEMKKQGIKSEGEMLSILSDAGLAYDLIRAGQGSPIAMYQSIRGVANKITSRLRDPSRNYTNLIEGLRKTTKPTVVKPTTPIVTQKQQQKIVNEAIKGKTIQTKKVPTTIKRETIKKPKQTPPAPKGPTVNVKKYARGEVEDLPRVEAPKGQALYGKGKAPIRKPIAPRK